MVLNNRNFKASLIVIDIKEYDVILGMDWQAQQAALIDCKKNRILIEIPEDAVQGTRDGEPKFFISTV